MADTDAEESSESQAKMTNSEPRDSAGGDRQGAGATSGPAYIWHKGRWVVGARWTHEP